MNMPLYLILVVLINLISQVKSLNSECPKLKNSRLSSNVRPHHYDLTERIDLNKLTFNGTVIIWVRIKRETNEITLHSKDLNIKSAQFVNNGVENMIKTTYCDEEETVTIYFGNSIKGEGKLEIHFAGNLSTKRVDGIYALKQFNGKEERYSVATDFEPTDARRAFPCFDEPSFKATFSITVVGPKDRTFLSNMPAINYIPISENETKVVFEKSLKMSTYLVCTIVGDYDFVEQQSIDGRVRIRVYTPVGRSIDGAFALNVSIRVVDFLQNYLGIEYPLPKLDIIAVKDLNADAMENWGLIVFQELYLLVNDETPISIRQTVASFVAHEIAHQWFGNLVTLKWWKHTWLNEGFATFFEGLLTHKLFQEWDYWPLFLSDSYSQALQIDSLHSSHPVLLNAINISEILEEAFDPVVYSKGGSVIRMLSEWIGEKEFREGLNRYLNAHKYSSAVTGDLLSSFHRADNINVKKVMNAWFKQKGYPSLKVLKHNCHFNRNRVKQQKFSIDGTNSDYEAKRLWKIPVNYSSANNTNNGKFVMQSRTRALRSTCVSDWNVRSIGFYRTQYTQRLYQNLFMEVKDGKIDAPQRFALQSDYFAFAKAGKESIVGYLYYLKRYTNEDQYFVWKSIDKSLSEISLLIADTSCSKKMNEYIRRLVANIHRKLDTSENKSDLTTLLRVLIYRRLGLLGDKDIVNNAFEQFDDYYNGRKAINPDYRSAIFEIVASNATDNTYNKLFELYKRNINDANKRSDLAKAMGSSDNVDQLRRALDFSLSNEVTYSDSLSIIISVGSSSDGIAWDFFVKNFDHYKTHYEKVTSLIKGIVSSLNSIEKANEVELFFKANQFKGIQSTLRMSLEMVRNRVKWFHRDAINICAYLNNN